MIILDLLSIMAALLVLCMAVKFLIIPLLPGLKRLLRIWVKKSQLEEIQSKLTEAQLEEEILKHESELTKLRANKTRIVLENARRESENLNIFSDFSEALSEEPVEPNHQPKRSVKHVQ